MLDISFEETRVYREVKEEGAIDVILRQLPRRLKQELSGETQTQITALPLPLLAELGEALLDFEIMSDLTAWLEAHQA